MRRWGAGALGRWGLVGLMSVGGMTRALTAQSPRPDRDSATVQLPPPQRHGAPAFVRYGKWVALGGAFALGYQANRLHQDANDSYQALRTRCFRVAGSCGQFPDGRYTDPVSERLYRDTRDSDHRAARYLLGAELSFAAAAAGFVWELLEREDRTPNIPFEPRVETGASSTRIGVAFRF